jgi:MYXO-CTERM domain-containing protein
VLDSALPQPVAPTPYVRLRDGPAALAMLAALALVLWQRRRRA